MGKSTKSPLNGKPNKPSADFPLFAHNTGRWAKKILGKVHYFGPWNDPAGALQNYRDRAGNLHAGRAPQELDQTAGIVVGDLCNAFMLAKATLVDSGELTRRSYKNYHNTCAKIVTAFGRNRRVASLRPDDFTAMRAKLAKDKAPNTLANVVREVRIVFKYGVDADLIPKAVKFGPMFRLPKRRDVRLARQANGKRMFEAAELRTILDTAKTPLKAMILLGINCGFGATDCAKLPLDALDLVGGWIDFPRPKTGVERRCPLWPETIDAIQDAIDNRPEPLLPSDSRLVFVTKYRQPWVRITEKGGPVDSVGKEFGKLLRELEIKRPGVNHYALRHTFQTIGGGARDAEAVAHIMGHIDTSMAGYYREGISDDRLQAVVDVVRGWLWPRKIS